MAARSRFLTFAVALLAAAAVPASPAMAAQTWYAAPSGAGTSCSQAAPCEMRKAVELAQAGDSVALLPGAYTLASELQLTRAISFGGASEADTTIQGIGSAGIEVNEVSGASLHDFRLNTAGRLELKTGSATRVFVDYSGTTPNQSACSMDSGASLTDSVCWAHGGGVGSAAIFTEAGDGTNAVTLHNDTAIASYPEGVGLYAELESSTGTFTVAVTNTIVHGGSHDVFGYSEGTSKLTVTMADSNYSTVEAVEPSTTITPPGTDGNQTAAPAFVAAATGNFVEAPGSPTIDAGLTEEANGATALAGEPRVLPAACDGPPRTDIGAYEFVPAPCPPSTSPPVTPGPTPQPQKPSNKITIGKLKKNPKKGTATLSVSVPGPGTIVLTGKGIRKVSRRAGAAATLVLPVKPSKKAKRRLSRTHSAKFNLSLAFTPIAGTAGTATRPVKLIQRAG